MTNVTISRELLERIDESAICDGTDATISDSLFTELVAALAAPVQGEAEPAAWLVKEHPNEFNGFTGRYRAVFEKPRVGIPLYTTPPQSAEVGELASDLKFLADYVWREYCGLSLPNYQALGRFPLDVAKAAIAKLGEKP